MYERLLVISFFLLFGSVGYFWGHKDGFKYAKDIATGKRWVKASKDFMHGLRKGD